MVSLAIMGLITAVVVFNQGDLSDTISLSNVANGISLDARRAQTYGVSVKQLEQTSFNAAYGLNFDLTDTGSNATYASFGGTTLVNGFYDPPGHCFVISGNTKCNVINRLPRGNIITKMCLINLAGSCLSVPKIEVSYIRPNPSASIAATSFDGTFIDFTSSPDSLAASIEITSPKGHKKTVYLYKTGQISVQ